MKIFKLFLVVPVLILYGTELFAAGMGGNGGPCPPFSPCWCASHPSHPACATPVPIDNNLLILLAVGLIMAMLSFRKKVRLIK